MKATVSTAENPLYKKLCSRFSYSGKTVGEMMLSRAREAGYASGIKRSDIKDMTVESCVTRANSLPRAHSGSAYAVTRPLFSARRINPCAALAVALFVLILSYLLVAGLTHRAPTFDGAQPDLPVHEVRLYEASLEAPLPY